MQKNKVILPEPEKVTCKCGGKTEVIYPRPAGIINGKLYDQFWCPWGHSTWKVIDGTKLADPTNRP